MISDRIKRVSPSQTLELNAKVAELRAEGKSIIALNTGEPDFNTPPPVIEAAHRAMLGGEDKIHADSWHFALARSDCAQTA